MKISFFLIYALCMLDAMFTEAFPKTYDPFPNQAQNCIRMTPETTKEINVMVEEITGFLNDMAVKHEDFDVRLVIVNIEQHSDDEPEEKKTVLQLNVNDCPKQIVATKNRNSEDFNKGNHGKIEEIDKNQRERDSDGSEPNNDVAENNKIKEKFDDELTDKNDFARDNPQFDKNAHEKLYENSNNDDETNAKHQVFDGVYDPELRTDTSDGEEEVTSKPELMTLEFPTEVQEFLEKIEKKKGKVTPLILYVQGEQGGNKNYMFLNTK